MSALPMWMATSLVSLSAGAYGIGVGSALIPWLNAELLMLAVLPLARSSYAVTAVVLAVTLGQMTGKCIVYCAARGARRPRSARVVAAIERWRTRVEQRPRAAASLVFGSALVGVPPFYLVSIAAGAAGMALSRFAVVGTCGRLLHFGVVAWLPEMIWRLV